MWFYDNWRSPPGQDGSGRTKRWYFLWGMNVLFNLIGWFIMGAGTYAAVVQIKDDIGEGNVSS